MFPLQVQTNYEGFTTLQRIDLCTFRLKKAILQELWIFFACMYTLKKISTTTVTWKIVCYWFLAPPMSLQCGLKYSLCSTEWIDVYYKNIRGNTSILWNCSFMIARATQHPCQLETAKSLKQAMNPAYFILRLQV